MTIDPRFNLGHANRAGAYESVGRDEAAYLGMLEAARLARSDGRRFMREDGLRFIQVITPAYAALTLGDYPTAAAGLKQAIEANTENTDPIRMLGDAQAAMHDPVAARATWARIPGLPADAPEEARVQDAMVQASSEGSLANQARDWPEVVRRLSGAPAAANLSVAGLSWRNANYPYLAMAMARMGDNQRAARVIAATRLDCYQCVIARGVIAEAAGDGAEADRWFAEAVRQAPSLPFAHEEWGKVKLARRDLAGAEADFREANRRSPNWADPLKGWGDVLMARNDARGAVRRYEAALQWAPQWQALRDALTRARRQLT